MSNESNRSDEISSGSSDGIAIPRSVRFWFFLLIEIPSIVCSFFVVGYLLFDRALRRAPQNHVIIILLIINLINQLTGIPWILNYYRLGNVWPATPGFCLIWIFIDEALYVTTTVLFAWANIERHILIFHDQWVATRIKLILFHYVPIGFLSLYCLSYNVIVIFFASCENTFDYSLMVCGYPLCYYENALVAVWDIVVNDIIPTIIIIFSSVALLIRVLYQKNRMRQPIRWKKHRKMTIQLLSISILYLLLYIPGMLLEFAYLCGVSEDIGADFMLYSKFFSYCGSFLLPFVCAGSLPNLQTKIKKLLPCCNRQTRVIAPRICLISHRTAARITGRIIAAH